MTIIVGYIATPEGRAALDEAITQARMSGDSLIVVNASPGDALADPRYASDDDIAAVRARLDDAGVAFTIDHRSDSDSVEHIVGLSGRQDVRMVVIGLRRRTPVGKLLMGSRAQRILLESACAVLAVKS